MEETEDMETNTAERARKANLIDGPIQMKYEKLMSRMFEGDRLERLWRLPVENLQQVSDALDGADGDAPPGSSLNPTTIIVSAITAYEASCRAAKQAELDASGPPASMSM